MKNQIAQFSLVIIAFVALTFLMSYTKTAPEEPKQYILILRDGKNFEKDVNQKLSDGWRLQGGAGADRGDYIQAMVK